MFYICVILLLGIIFLGTLYLNEKLEKENDKFLYNKEIESLKNSNKQIIEELKGYKEELATWKTRYNDKCRIIENEFEKKYAEELWLKQIREDKELKKIREDFEELEKWRDSILDINIDDRFIKSLQEYVNCNQNYFYRDSISTGFAKVLQTFKEVETLKQELATQTANNIILKDELNKLKQ
jgi:cell division protein FtsB